MLFQRVIQSVSAGMAGWTMNQAWSGFKLSLSHIQLPVHYEDIACWVWMGVAAMPLQNSTDSVQKKTVSLIYKSAFTSSSTIGRWLFFAVEAFIWRKNHEQGAERNQCCWQNRIPLYIPTVHYQGLSSSNIRSSSAATGLVPERVLSKLHTI